MEVAYSWNMIARKMGWGRVRKCDRKEKWSPNVAWLLPRPAAGSSENMLTGDSTTQCGNRETQLPVSVSRWLLAASGECEFQYLT